MSDIIKHENNRNRFSELQNESNKTHDSNKKTLLTDENFKRLIKFQEGIFAVLEMTPSFRKIINSLITDENLNVLKSKFLKENNKE